MTSPSLPSSPTHKPRHVGPHESTDLASQVRDHFEGRIPEGAHPSAFLKPSEVSLLERARAEPLGVSKLADPVHRAGIVLRALSDGSSVDLDITGKGQIEKVALGDGANGRTLLCIERQFPSGPQLLSIDEIGLGGFLDACARLSEADVVGIAGGNALRQISAERNRRR